MSFKSRLFKREELEDVAVWVLPKRETIAEQFKAKKLKKKKKIPECGAVMRAETQGLPELGVSTEHVDTGISKG